VSIATDYYYACLDGNWNADGDNIWARRSFRDTATKPTAVDLRPELRVGRVPASIPRRLASGSGST